MEYKVITVPVSIGFLGGTNFEESAERLASEVNLATRLGWKPQGGIAVGTYYSSRRQYLAQAMIKE